jgi:hypothetical protein
MVGRPPGKEESLRFNRYIISDSTGEEPKLCSQDPGGRAAEIMMCKHAGESPRRGTLLYQY